MTASPVDEVLVERYGRATCRYLGAHQSLWLQAFLADPATTFANGSTLKEGNSATVARVAIGDRDYIVKRYNVKSVLHRLRLSVKRRSRGRNAWRFGQTLHGAGVFTARPVALLETRRGLLRDVVYLVMEDLGDCNLRDALLGSSDHASQTPWMRAVVEMFLALQELGVCHGDTKATNFLVRGDRVALIDLDSMRADPSGRGIVRDVRRFLANWRDHPVVQRAFAEAFRTAGLPAA